MALPVLATKLFIPPPRPQAVRRPHLTERLTAGLEQRKKLTLVSAPAGFGKTSLLADWIAASVTRHPHAKFAWVSLDDSDNDPVRFVAYLYAALEKAEPGVDVRGHPVQADAQETLASLADVFAESGQQIVLVLDDFQVIENFAIRDAIAFLLDHLPAEMHVVIASRADPLLPISRLRARGELMELRAADLKFTPRETATYLNERMGLSLSPEHLGTLVSRTEGWIAGLQLAALSVRDSLDVSAFVAGFTGSHRFVIDYLVDEVLQRQPDDVRDFLLRTAVLERMTGPVCDAVTGRTGGREMLESLERANLFVVPLDDRREWYRYHRLFADVLRARLQASGPARAAELHTVASEWFERNALPDEAVSHALAGSNFALAARVIESVIPSVRRSRQDATLLTWLAALPTETVERRPVLGVFSAWSSLVGGDIAAVEPRLAAAERMLSTLTADGGPAHDSEPGDELRTLPVTIALYRAALAQATGDIDELAEQARRARDLAGLDDHLGRGAATGMLGLASWARGDLEGGVRAFGETRASLVAAGNLADALSTTLVLVDMLAPLGRLREAQSLIDEALALALERETPNGQPLADLHAGVSELHLQRDEIASATEHLAAGEALGEAAFSRENRYRWFMAKAGILTAEGRLDDAFDLLDTAEQVYRRGFFPEVRPIGAVKARVRIAQERLTDAATWVDEQGLSSTVEPAYLDEFAHITRARLLIARADADSLTQAGQLLDRLLDSADAGGRVGSAIEISTLQALTLHAQGTTSLALIPLERALTQAEPEGYVRLFLDEGAPMLTLLRAAAGAGIRPDYVRRLTQGLRGSDHAVRSEALPDPLSERELHVLRLLATALTGPEIARELFVSLNTMRTHTKHIFAKLDVNTRPDAVRRGEALGLI